MKSDCHVSLGMAASKRMYEDLGFFLGSGVTRPALLRYRLMVAEEMVMLWWVWRCQAMVSGPASSPLLVRCLRRSMMRVMTSGGVLLGLVWGVRGRGVKAASPSFL